MHLRLVLQRAWKRAVVTLLGGRVLGELQTGPWPAYPTTGGQRPARTRAH